MKLRKSRFKLTATLNAGRKQKRAIRRRNRIALDLADNKYRQRKVKNKKKDLKPNAKEWID